VSVRFNTLGYSATSAGADDCAASAFGTDMWFVTPPIAAGTQVLASVCGKHSLF